ncbi:glycosyl hydrolase family 28-related protein [Sphingobium aquiterrae]|uniref:glycosyl hydrolase family 28-related protein n=1 Tax=Sphingobium aquiterrae TaxID=2038656 RepID=UPI0030190A38
MRSSLLALAVMLAPTAAAAAGPSTSLFATMPNDAAAVVVTAKGDGRTDDTAAIQAAIDRAAASGHGGIVFLPSGRYRITRTLNILPAVRIFGVGPTRPVLLLADNTPGFQKGVATMLVFSGDDQYNVGKIPFPVETTVPSGTQIRDATSSTFYSALGNVDFEIGQGNPAAAAVRFRTAQHSFLSHVDFHIGSGFAGVYNVGNVMENVRFFGGRYGIVTEKTSPAWPFTLLDGHFEGQRDAAIREHEAGLTLVNTSIRDTPVGIDIDRGYGDWLWGKDVRFENISKAAVIISNEGNAYTQIGFENALASKVPVFARFRDSGKTVAGAGGTYKVSEFTYGLKLDGLGTMGSFATNMQAAAIPALPAPRARAIRALPGTGEWTDVRTLGARGDGATDDSAAIQKAIDTHRVLYFPAGHYMVSDTLRLRPDTVLIGLHPSLTQLVLPDGLPAYAGVGSVKPLIESARGGDAIVFGLGLYTGGYNPRATALLWKAGADSLVDDVKIQGGGGTFLPGGKRLDVGAPMNRWDGQYPSIWVTDGGGGTFSSVWSPNTFSQAGFHVSNTKTPGHVYELSAEHHVRAEIVLDGVENWEFLAPQTEQEVRDGVDAVSMEIRNSRNILFANYHGYRVTRSIKPMDTAVRLYNSGDIRFRNVHVNGESGYATCDANGCATYLRASKFPFENAIKDMRTKSEVREREFAVLDVPASPVPARTGLAGARVEKLEGDFFSISGAAVDAAGKLHFVDHKFHRIYAWSPDKGLEIVQDAPLDPVNLAFDRSGNLLVLSSDGPEGTVYSVRPGSADIRLIPPTPVAAHPGATVLLPANVWNNGEFKDQLNPETYEFTTLAEMFARDVAVPKAREYVSPDGSLVLPAFRVLQQGPANPLGWRWSDTLQTYGFVTARQGERVAIVNGSENRTYSGLLGPGGSITDLKPIADRGGESVAIGPDGRTYVANGQVFVYAPNGKAIDRIDVPERPLQLIFGGPDRRTLYILTHHSLYALGV